MKNLFLCAFLLVISASANANANANEPASKYVTDQQIQKCAAVVEEAITTAVVVLGYTQGTMPLGGVQPSAFKRYADGRITAEWHGGPLASPEEDGYWTGAFASATAIFSKNSCRVIAIRMHDQTEYSLNVENSGKYEELDLM